MQPGKAGTCQALAMLPVPVAAARHGDGHRAMSHRPRGRDRRSKAGLLRQESRAKPLRHPSKGLQHAQPHGIHPTERGKEIVPHQEPVPLARNKRTTEDPPAGDASREKRNSARE